MYIYIYIYLLIYLFTYLSIYLFISVFIHSCICICVHVCREKKRVCLCVCVCTCQLYRVPWLTVILMFYQVEGPVLSNPVLQETTSECTKYSCPVCRPFWLWHGAAVCMYAAHVYIDICAHIDTYVYINVVISVLYPCTRKFAACARRASGRILHHLLSELRLLRTRQAWRGGRRGAHQSARRADLISSLDIRQLRKTGIEIN